jgi:hypothetical protein
MEENNNVRTVGNVRLGFIEQLLDVEELPQVGETGASGQAEPALVAIPSLAQLSVLWDDRRMLGPACSAVIGDSVNVCLSTESTPHVKKNLNTLKY